MAFIIGDAVPVKGDIPILVNEQASRYTLERIAALPDIEAYYPAWDHTYSNGEMAEKLASAKELLNMLKTAVIEIDEGMLGVKVKIDGTHIGTEVAPMLRAFYEGKSVDLESLYFDPEYEGLMDYVVVADLVRSPMGTFQALYANNEKRWNAPREADIAAAKVAGIDPFFIKETIEAAKLCVKNKVPYVTIDCPHTDYLHQNSAINIVSKECLSEHYKGIEKEEVFEKLISTTDGLVIITTGQNDMIYGRKNTGVHYMPVFATKVESTLGAGDTFKAGCIYGLLHGFTDEDIVRFAAAASSIAISRYPLPLSPPTLDEINSRL